MARGAFITRRPNPRLPNAANRESPEDGVEILIATPLNEDLLLGTAA